MHHFLILKTDTGIVPTWTAEFKVSARLGRGRHELYLFVLNLISLHMKGETTRQKIEYRRGPERLAILADLIKQLCVFHLYFKHDYSSEISSQAPN